jgi:hypothetical protein
MLSRIQTLAQVNAAVSEELLRITGDMNAVETEVKFTV